MALNFLWLGLPRDQPAGDLHAAKSALFVAINGFVSPSYLWHCRLCDDDGGRCSREADDLEQRCYQLANLATAVLGMALIVFHMAFSASAVLPPVARWLVWFTKVLTCGTLQFDLNIFHFCLKMIYFKLMLAYT